MLIVDRIEGTVAVCETADGSMQSFDSALFVPKVYEGGCYDEQDGSFFYNEAETNRRREEAAALMAELFGEDAVEE